MFLYTRNKFLFFSCIFLFAFKFSFTQIDSDFGNPYIRNFSKKEVNKNLKVFEISQNNKGELFFATPGNLLEYDGLIWSEYFEKDQTDLRAVLHTKDSLIYTAGHGGFGFWKKNNIGELSYNSLFFKYPTKDSPLLPVFSNIVSVENKVFFQSFQQINVYNPKSKTIEQINATKGFSSLFLVNDDIIVQDVSVGLFKVKNLKKNIIEGSEKLAFNVIGIYKKSDSSLVLATENNGFWNLKNGILKKTSWLVNTELEDGVISCITELDDQQIAVGTLRKGIYIISKDGKKLSNYDTENGIDNNSIKTIFKDINNNLWAGTESGLSYIEVNSKTKYILDNKSKFGTVYTSLLNKSNLYIGTNQGLFLWDILSPFSKPKIIKNSPEQIWTIKRIDNQILVGSDKGIFKLKDDKLETIHLEGGGWTFKKHPKINNLIYVGFYSGIAVFEFKNSKWNFIKKFQNFGESSRFIEFDQYDQLWVTHPSKGYYRIKLTSNGLEIQDFEFYGKENSALDTYAYFTKIDENLVFYNPKGFYYFDIINNKFSKADYPSKIFKGLQNINYIKQYENIFWYSTDSSFGYIIRNGNDFIKTHEAFYDIWNNHLNDFNKVVKISSNKFIAGIDNGLIFHDVDYNFKNFNFDPPLIKSVNFISSVDTIKATLKNNKDLKIPYNNNFLKVTVALPSLPLSSSRQFQYRLKNNQMKWSDWITNSEIKFPGLKPGFYTLELRSRTEVDYHSEVSNYSFEITSPWYLSTVSKIIYLLIIVFVFLGYRNFLKHRNDKYVEKLKLIEKEKRQRQREKFELEKLGTDKELLLLKEKNLNLEIKKKDSALALSTLNNIKKNELLNDLINDLKVTENEFLNSSINSPISRVLKKINRHLKDKEDWLTFELHFRNSHSQFFDNLINRHSDLTSNEIKLCAYLKLNLSSKEIASLMNVAVASVEQSRYRLRKKFKLNKTVNLLNYIQKF